jgi:hypothetical protein
MSAAGSGGNAPIRRGSAPSAAASLPCRSFLSAGRPPACDAVRFATARSQALRYKAAPVGSMSCLIAAAQHLYHRVSS